MKLSVDKDSPHYDPVKSMHCHVFYEGIPVKHAVELDTDEGWIDVLVADDAGRLIREGDSWKTERLHGEITISFCKPRSVTE